MWLQVSIFHVHSTDYRKFVDLLCHHISSHWVHVAFSLDVIIQGLIVDTVMCLHDKGKSFQVNPSVPSSWAHHSNDEQREVSDILTQETVSDASESRSVHGRTVHLRMYDHRWHAAERHGAWSDDSGQNNFRSCLLKQCFWTKWLQYVHLFFLTIYA